MSTGNSYIVLVVLIALSPGIAFAQPASISIRQVREKRQDREVNQKALLEHPYVVEGYFFKDPLPLLTTKKEWAFVNSRIPDSAYIVLDPLYFSGNVLQLQGAYLRLTGVVNPREDTLQGRQFINGKEERYDVDFILRKPPEVIIPKTGIANPHNVSINPVPTQKRLSIAGQKKNYAFIYSGGINKAQANTRFWNDIKFLYKTLNHHYGYLPDQIIVIYKDGKSEDGEVPVDYPANSNGLEKAFAELDQRLNGGNLFFYMTNHGDGYDEDDPAKRLGFPDQQPYDEVDPYKYDEISYYYYEPPGIRDDYFAAKINSLHFDTLSAVFQPCYGGGFIYDLRGPGRVLISATSEFTAAWSNDQQTFDEFSYYFIAALNEANEKGDPLNDVDKDHNGRISLLEAFNYAKKKDKQKDKPQLEDSGDGQPASNPAPVNSSDGKLASATFISAAR